VGERQETKSESAEGGERLEGLAAFALASMGHDDETNRGVEEEEEEAGAGFDVKKTEKDHHPILRADRDSNLLAQDPALMNEEVDDSAHPKEATTAEGHPDTQHLDNPIRSGSTSKKTMSREKTKMEGGAKSPSGRGGAPTVVCARAVLKLPVTPHDLIVGSPGLQSLLAAWARALSSRTRAEFLGIKPVRLHVPVRAGDKRPREKEANHSDESGGGGGGGGNLKTTLSRDTDRDAVLRETTNEPNDDHDQPDIERDLDGFGDGGGPGRGPKRFKPPSGVGDKAKWTRVSVAGTTTAPASLSAKEEKGGSSGDQDVHSEPTRSKMVMDRGVVAGGDGPAVQKRVVSGCECSVKFHLAKGALVTDDHKWAGEGRLPRVVYSSIRDRLRKSLQACSARQRMPFWIVQFDLLQDRGS